MQLQHLSKWPDGDRDKIFLICVLGRSFQADEVTDKEWQIRWCSSIRVVLAIT